MRKIYPDNSSMNKAALLLASMAPDMVDDIIALVNAKGGSLKDDLFANDNTASASSIARPLAVFSRTYIADEDFDSTWLGFVTIMLASLRKPTYSNDSYQTILSDAYSLPAEIAEPLAKKIETYDVLGSANTGILGSFANAISEGVRKTLNWAAEVLNTGWEIDESQAYDIDFLYEMKNLGQVVDDLNSRVRLMSAQAAIANSMNVLQTGDPGENDQDEMEMRTGDIFSRMKLRKLPPSVGGGLKHLMTFGHNATRLQGKKVLDAAGFNVTKNGTVMNTSVKHPHMRKVIDRIMNAKPSTAVLAGAALGLSPLAIQLIRMKRQGQFGEPGDSNNNMYDAVGSMYGDTVANAWLNGDVEGMLRGAIDDADQEVTTGDVELDRTIAQMVDETGDPADGTEIGGLFRRMRINAARRKAGRRTRRTTRKMGKQFRKNKELQQLEFYKDQGQSALPGSYDDQSYDQGSDDQGSDDSDQGGDDQGGGGNGGQDFDYQLDLVQ